VTNGIATDSTNLENNGALTLVAPAAGEIDGAATFNGTSSYLQIPGADFPSYPNGVYDDLGLPESSTTTPFTASFGVWFETASAGGILTQVPSEGCSYFLGACIGQQSIEPGYYDPGGWNPMLYVNDDGKLVVSGADSGGGIITVGSYNDNHWHFAAVTYAGDGTNTLYVDGQSVGSARVIPTGYSSAYNYFVGTAYTFQAFEGNWNWLYFNGNLDDVSVSNTALSSDWVQTEYNNQGSPSTFYRFYPRSVVQVAPAAVSLYASQTQQFTVPGSCDAAVTFSILSSAPGTITSGGLYTAPGNVSSTENVTVTATNTASETSVGSAAVTLLPPPSPITLAPSAQSPYTTGTSQAFTATVLKPDGTPVTGAAVTFTVTGVNLAIGSVTTGSNGVATYSYTGAATGTDSIQATTSVDEQLLTSNTVAASWVNPVPVVEVAGVTLNGPSTLGAAGLIGAFTGINGTVIEPISIGASATEFIVPTGATRLQLGIDTANPTADGGPGYVVAINGNPVTVPPTATPWSWTAGGVNNNYQYGLLNPGIQSGILDGTGPVVAATSLMPGTVVTIAYQSGSVSEDLSIRPLVNANGDQTWITGTNEWEGTYFPTLYTTASAYPVGQPITFNALVTNSNGAPALGVPVTLAVSGANPGEYESTTDSTGTASFIYKGTYSGADSLVAQATPSGGSTLNSSLSSVTWVTPVTPQSGASLSLSLFGYVNDNYGYVVYLTDASGNPIPNANVGVYVWGVDNFSEANTTDSTGHAMFTYMHSKPGPFNFVAVATVNGSVIFSNVITGTWTSPTTTNTCNNCNNVTVSIAAQTTVTMPNSLQLNGTVTDNVGITPTIQWSQVSGPGIVTFTNSQQAVTSATFSQIGTYVVQLYASDTGASATSQFTVSVIPTPIADASQGWIGSPLYGSQVSGIVPITLAPGISLASGTLSYMPASNTNDVTVLNSSVSGSGQIGSFDTTALANGAYWIQLQATNSVGQSGYSLVLVYVTGNYKPGRVTSTVTDLVVPSTGVAISIQRSYDSLNAGTSSDFGYGWSLGINVNLTVSPKGDVTFTLGGQRKTFYLTPQPPPCSALIGCLFPYYFAQYTPEPGLHGMLTDASVGCPPLDIVVADGSLWECQDGNPYNPSAYTYTDPNGTQYNISATGGLQSITDRSGNGITITSAGITSNTGLSVPFLRDDQNRITQITDPQGNIYQYSYDTNGNLSTVTYPNTSQPSTYTYNTSHLYLSGTDFRNDPLPTAQYFTSADTDPAGNRLAGKLESVTDGLGETTSYAYNLSTNTTTVTYPPDAGSNIGHATMVYDALGDLLTSTDPLNHTTTNTYDANENLLSTTDPLGHTTSYTYDSNGNKTSQTYPATATSTNTTSTTAYNQYSEPTATTDELGHVRMFNYDANYNPQSVTDSAGTLMSTLFNTNGTLQAGAVGYDLTAAPARASQFTYDAYGNIASKTDALGRTTSYTYNSLGQKVTMVEPIPSGSNAAAATTTYTYDAFGNLTQTSAPLGRVTSSQYDGNGNKTSDTDARSHTTTYQYDNLNRLILTTYPDTTTSSKTYDFRNNVVTETDQGGHVTLHQYDLAGRQISVTQAYGTANATTIGYTYDSAGRKTAETDALSHVTNYTYDAAANLLSVAGVAGNFSYAYDNARNQISMTDGNSNTTHYQYDTRKRLALTTYPDSSTKTNA
jgi:YD repeat-containing protein